MQTEHANHRIRVFKKIAMVLDYVADAQGPISVAAMAEDLRLPRATVYRILDVLEKEDILLRNGSNYRLGNRLLNWCASSLDYYSLRDLTRLHATRTSNGTG